MPITFAQNNQIYLGIYLSAGPTCLYWLCRFHVPTHWANPWQLSGHYYWKTTFFQISVLSISEKGNRHWVPNLGCMGAADFPLEFLQQFMSLVSNMESGIILQERHVLFSLFLPHILPRFYFEYQMQTYSLPVRNGSRFVPPSELTFPDVFPFQSLWHVCELALSARTVSVRQLAPSVSILEKIFRSQFQMLVLVTIF